MQMAVRFNVADHQGNANQNQETSPQTCRKGRRRRQVLLGMQRGGLVCSWDRRRVQPLWERWRVRRKSGLERPRLSGGSEISVSGCLRPVFTAGPPTVATAWKRPSCPSAEGGGGARGPAGRGRG